MDKQDKLLPKNITFYDLLKAAAVIIMVTDHIGYYFFPENMWWRAVGRIGFPIWFFLVGYARGRDFSPKLWGGSAVLIVGNLITGMFILPLNALASMIIIRLLIDKIMKFALMDFEKLFMVCFVLLLLIPVSSDYFEYGSEGLLVAMLGYIVRHRPEFTNWSSSTLIKIMTLFSFAHFFFIQGILFEFSLLQLLVMGAGLIVVYALLMNFKSLEYPALTQKLPGVAVSTIEFMGRRTLEIYVMHLLVFKFAVVTFGPERFQWFQWTWQMP